MLKNKSTGLLILFLLFASFLILSKSLQKQSPKPQNNPKTFIEKSLPPLQSVINFYSKYLAYKGDLLSEDAYGKSENLTDDFKNKLKTEINSKPILNPILCSTQKPDQVIFHQATLSGSLARVLVTQTFQNQKKDHLVKLKQVGKEYKIYDIICN